MCVRERESVCVCHNHKMIKMMGPWMSFNFLLRDYPGGFVWAMGSPWEISLMKEGDKYTFTPYRNYYLLLSEAISGPRDRSCYEILRNRWNSVSPLFHL